MDDFMKAVLAVAFGWLLKELSDLWKVRREDRKPLAECLSLLLDVHHLMFMTTTGVRLVEEALRGRSLDAEVVDAIRPHFRRAVVGPDGAITRPIEERYNEVIRSLAQVDPLLAYELRHQGGVWSMVEQIIALQEELLGSMGLTAEYDGLHDFVGGQILPRLEESIRRVSWKLGMWTWVKARATVSGKEAVIKTGLKDMLDAKLDELLESIQVNVEDPAKVAEVFGLDALKEVSAADADGPDESS